MKKSERKAVFYVKNPFCIFCGGAEPSVTKEHCPPKALFQNKRWAKGFEFAACIKCNTGSSGQDLLISMFAKTGWSPRNNTSDDNALHGLIGLSRDQNPGMLERMVLSAESKLIPKHRNSFGLIPEPYNPQHQIAINLPVEFDHAMNVFARKLAKGIYYREAKKIFPNDGTLLMQYFTNAEWTSSDESAVFAMIQAAGGVAPPVVNGKTDLSDQFWHHEIFAPEVGIFALQANFTGTFRIEILGSTVPGQLEAMVDAIVASKGNGNPWRVIQPV